MATETVRFLADGSGVTLTPGETPETYYLTLDDASGWRGVFDVGGLRSTPAVFLGSVVDALGQETNYVDRVGRLEACGCPCVDSCNEEQSR